MDPSTTELQVSTTGQKIVILIPEKPCNQYLNVSTTTLLPVLHAMVIQPALMQVLYELKEVAQKIYPQLKKDDILVGLGAGTITELGKELLKLAGK